MVTAISISTTILLILIILNPKTPKKLVISVIILEIILYLCDYLFLQPWAYIYFVTFSAFSFFKENSEKRNSFLRLFISSVYIFSGFHKLNWYFLDKIWHKMIFSDYFRISESTFVHYKLFFAGLSVPMIETTLGLMLFFPKSRKIGAISLIVMHAIITLFFSPIGINFNSIIIGWNLCSIFLLYILFLRRELTFSEIKLFWYYMVFGIPFIAICLGSTSYLTFCLYTGKNEQLFLVQDSPYKDNFLNSVKVEKNKKFYLNLQKWSLEETNMPPTPEVWYFDKMEKTLKARFPKAKIKRIKYAKRLL